MKSRCPVTQQRSPAQDGVSHRIHKASPQKTMFNRRYVQWLAFHSILLWVVPSDKIYPKSACESEAPMEQSSWIYHSTNLSSFFSFEVRSNGDVFSHWTEVNLLLLCPPPCWYVCRLPLSIVLFHGRLFNWMLAHSCSWWKGLYYGSAYQNHISLPTGK